MCEVEKVVIYFPWKEISGGPIYLVRLAEELAKENKYHVYYVDYEDGFSRKLLIESKVENITVSQDDFSIPMDEPVTVITPIYFACWLPNLHPDSKLLFVNWHICCVPTLQHNWQISNSNLSDFLKLVQETRSVFFCDESHRLGQNRPDLDFERSIVPITLPDKKRLGKQELVNKDEVNFVILGRLCRDKIYSVINVLDNLNPINIELKKIVHIIGDGPDRVLIDADKYKNLELKFAGELEPDELSDYLSKKCDCLFAMGTSVLEGASMAIPSVIIPHNMQPMDCDKYVYIQDSKGYCLGWYDNQFDVLELKPITMEKVLSDILDVDGKHSLGSLAYDYYLKHHTIIQAGALFTHAIENSTLTYKRLKSRSDYYSKVAKSINFFGRSVITLNKKQYGIDANLFGRVKLFSLKNHQDPSWKIVFRGNSELFMIKRSGFFFKFARVESKLTNIKKSIQSNDFDSVHKLDGVKDNQPFLDKIDEEITELDIKIGQLIGEVTRLNDKLEYVNEYFAVNNRHIFEKLDRILYSDFVTMDTCDKLLSEESLNYFCGDVKYDYINLIRGLDSKSIELVNRIINRIQKYKDESTSIFYLVNEEKEMFKEMMDYHSSRLTRLNDEYYAYGEYVLPSNIITSTVFFYDCFMPELLYLEKYKDKHIVDAGGSFGDSALVLSKYTEKQVHVFEPTSQMYEMGQKTILENNLREKVVFNKKALGAKRQRLNIKVDYDFSTLCINESEFAAGNIENVEIISLDEYVKQHDLNIGVIKVDVEGFEEQLLEGALNTIKTQRPALLFSIYHSSEQFFGIKPLIESLNLGYKFKIRKPLDRSIITDTILIAEVES